MYYIESNSNMDGIATQVIRVPQYTQCDGRNHLTSDYKEVTEFRLRPDAIRHLANLIANYLTYSNSTVLKASQGYAKLRLEYINKVEVVTYKVKQK